MAEKFNAVVYDVLDTDEFEEVAREFVDTTRWTSYHDVIVKRLSDGKHFCGCIHTETGDMGESARVYNEDEQEWIEVEQIPVTKLEWQPVK